MVREGEKAKNSGIVPVCMVLYVGFEESSGALRAGRLGLWAKRERETTPDSDFAIERILVS
jgi:hypothetical protein